MAVVKKAGNGGMLWEAEVGDQEYSKRPFWENPKWRSLSFVFQHVLVCVLRDRGRRVSPDPVTRSLMEPLKRE